ncbi:D-alanine--D-alanine ligase family protein [Aestuariimicrobium ganziense]|uniref:D-alanine--D-alanine ligase family protein n=1 Tax=Aestuariimicrobium ganziense TaxID=2773677 RepID=UPI001941F083|nr:D-alanine--D-alanine ligase family protein [Aestuariimicrobium ganziense]
MSQAPSQAPRPRVVVVFGGASSEHPVSCLTAASVLKAIDRDRYDVDCVGITEGGRWTRIDPLWAARMATTAGRLPTVPDDGVGAVLVQDDERTLLCSVTEDGFADVVAVDVAFSLLHGPFGEDGTIQGQFEMVGLRYVGSGVAASAIGMDKHLMKVALAAAGLPQGDYRVIRPEQWVRDQAAALASLDGLSYPLFVKPARAGSSIGITRVTSPDELPAAIEGARKHDPKVVVEAGIVGAREIECAVLGGRGFDTPRASLVGEIRMHTEEAFYDFDAKYLPEEQVSLDIPADVDDDLQRRVQDLAVATFEAMGAEGLGRVDTFVLPDGQVLVNEINTMPGFTELSMFPALWNETGMSYPDLVDELLTLALQRPVGLR